MKKIKITYLIIFSLSLFTFACQNSTENQTSKVNSATISPTPNVVNTPSELQKTADVPKFANKSAAELDKIFGQPEKITPATLASEKPGEYRLYKMAGHPKGLSVRFYKDKAVRFNLILGTPEKSSRDALLKYFGIDVTKMTVVKGDSLSETWKGTSNGVNFSTAYAKRDDAKSDFVMIHAEIGQ